VWRVDAKSYGVSATTIANGSHAVGTTAAALRRRLSTTPTAVKSIFTVRPDELWIPTEPWPWRNAAATTVLTWQPRRRFHALDESPIQPVPTAAAFPTTAWRIQQLHAGRRAHVKFLSINKPK